MGTENCNSQALQSKFLVTAKGRYWQALWEKGCQPILSIKLYFLLILAVNFYLDSGCTLYFVLCCVLVYCTCWTKIVSIQIDGQNL